MRLFVPSSGVCGVILLVFAFPAAAADTRGRCSTNWQLFFRMRGEKQTIGESSAASGSASIFVSAPKFVLNLDVRIVLDGNTAGMRAELTACQLDVRMELVPRSGRWNESIADFNQALLPILRTHEQAANHTRQPLSAGGVRRFILGYAHCAAFIGGCL